MTQDRGAGISGRIDTYPRITPLYISISENGELVKEVSLQIINDEFLFTSLANSAALQAVDSALDRIGPGSATSKLKIMGRGLPELQITSTDMYYSQNDIGSTSLSDFSQLLDLILTNPFKKINLIDIRLEINFNKKDSVALIQEARVLNDKIYPGDELEVEVTLHRYRNGTETKNLTMKIPEDVEPGIATLFIDGGYTGETLRAEENNQPQSTGGLNEAEISGHTSFESLLQSYLDSPDNNDLILQLYPSYAAPAYQESSKSAPGENPKQTPEAEINEENSAEDDKEEKDADSKADDSGEEIKERHETDYVLEGSLNLDLEILDPADKSSEAAGENRNENNNNSDKAEINEEVGIENSSGAENSEEQ